MSAKTYKPLDDMVEQKGLKYGFVADELGVTTQRLYTMRINPRSMSIEQMEKLAQILGVTFMDIYKVQKKFRQQVDKNATKEQKT